MLTGLVGEEEEEEEEEYSTDEEEEPHARQQTNRVVSVKITWQVIFEFRAVKSVATFITVIGQQQLTS